MIITYVDSNQIDRDGLATELGSGNVETIPRIGEKQVLHFPNMPQQNYVVKDVVHSVHIGDGGTSALTPEQQQHLPPQMVQMVNQQIQQTQRDQPRAKDQILVVLRKLDEAPQQ